VGTLRLVRWVWCVQYSGYGGAAAPGFWCGLVMGAGFWVLVGNFGNCSVLVGR
jgi:hypothetical protein